MFWISRERAVSAIPPTVIGSLLIACGICGCERVGSRSSEDTRILGGLGLGPGQFQYPRGITTDRLGRVFVVDKTGRIQRFGPDGTFEVGWTTPESEAGKPVGLAAHPDGRLFVPDTHYHRVLIYDSYGALLDSFGSEGMGDGEFGLPTDVAFDRDGYIYVGEYHQNDRVTKWTSDLDYVSSVGADPIEGQRLSRPSGLAIDDEQTLWVVDSCNHRLIRFSRDGLVLNVFGGYGAAAGQMKYPYDIAITRDGSLVVCEYEGCRLQWFSRDGRSLRTWGRPGRRAGELFAPWGVAVGRDGNVFVVDSQNDRVQIVRP